MNMLHRSAFGGLDEQLPLVAHVIHRLDYGGMETVLVDLINHMGDAPYRHAVICLKDYTEFRERIRSPAVEVIALRKREGKDLPHYGRLWRELRRLRPAIVNTYSIATLDLAPIARLAGGRVVHAEHGWQQGRDDVQRKYIRLRRMMLPFIDRFVAVSRDLQSWLEETVRLPPARLTCIYNGVEADAFQRSSRAEARARLGIPVAAFVIGTVARLVPVKAQVDLVEAFADLRARLPTQEMRLVLVGEGPERANLESVIRARGLGDHVWLAGARDDVPQWLAAFDVFALPSRNEGVSIAALEAMASGLPVVASCVGGNPEVVVDGETGLLTPPGDVAALSAACGRYVGDADLAQRHGAAGRTRMLRDFSIEAMVSGYRRLYDAVLAGSAASV